MSDNKPTQQETLEIHKRSREIQLEKQNGTVSTLDDLKKELGLPIKDNRD